MPSAGADPIILASSSPRRRDLLEQVGIPFEVVSPDETAEGLLTAGRSHRETALAVVRAAEAKARSVAAQVAEGRLVVAGDTVVLLDERLLGKPRDAAEAAEMLRALSGREHRVVTGLAVLRAGEERSRADYEETRVRFRVLEEVEIAAYVASGEPLDKAGAYAIQGLGALLVEGIEGDYCNVVGLPLGKLHRLLRGFGLDLLRGETVEGDRR